jgi:type IV pilus assembly protein PilV
MARTERFQSGLRRCRGLTLVEVLVTVIVLAFGLLGLAGLQVVGLKNNTSAYHRTQATFLSYDIIDRLHANAVAAEAGNYDVAFGSSAPAGGNGLISAEISEWKGTLARELPSGDGAIDCTSNSPVCNISVRWDDTRGTGSLQTLMVSVEL